MVDRQLYPAISRALQQNEIGDGSPYELSYARYGASGGSFGIFQGDTNVDERARAALIAVLDAAGTDAAVRDRIIAAVSQPCPNGSPLTPEDQRLVDAALETARGKAIVDAMDEAILAVILRELDTSLAAANAAGLTIEPSGQLGIALWANMTGAPTTLNRWIAGETVRGVQPPSHPTVTRADMSRYLAASSYFQMHPRNLKHFEASVDAGRRLLPGTVSPTLATAAPAALPAGFPATAAATATAEWQFFGRQTYDASNHLTAAGHKEGEEGYYQRIQSYWEDGTHTHGLDGRDHDVPWSAAFISWIMWKAGAGTAFRYSTQHSVYISQAIRDQQNGRPAAYLGRRLNAYQPKVGDLVCWARQAGVDFDHQAGGNYAGHSDLVVDVSASEILIIGGNVGDSVTRRPLTLENGYLTERTLGGELLFAIMECRA